jgi:hypothetical protein
MKLFLLALIFTALAFSQATITITVPGETNTTIVIQPEGFNGIENAIMSQVMSFGGAPVTLTSATTTATTTFLVSAVPSGLTTTNGVMIGTEVSQISAIATGVCPRALTVQRARLGTVAVASASGTAVKFLQAGKGGTLIGSLLQQWLVKNLPAYPGPIIIAAQAAIATQNATINAALDAVATIQP